jgi:hypothetical protein
MDHAFIKFGATLVLGGTLIVCPAYALSPQSLNGGISLIIPAADEENKEIMEDLRPDEVPDSADSKKEEAPAESTESGSGNEENKELWRDLETGVTPPPGD